MAVRKGRGLLTLTDHLTTSVLGEVDQAVVALTTAKANMQIPNLAVTELETAVYTAAGAGDLEPHGAAVTVRLVGCGLFGVMVQTVHQEPFRTNTVLNVQT